MTLAALGATASAKFATVIARSAAGEKASPLLLACTLTLLVPNGQFSVAPGETPHPPVQFKAVKGQWSGSENPSCEGVRLAPSWVLPLTASVVGPCNTGRVCSAD